MAGNLGILPAKGLAVFPETVVGNAVGNPGLLLQEGFRRQKSLFLPPTAFLKAVGVGEKYRGSRNKVVGNPQLSPCMGSRFPTTSRIKSCRWK